MMVRTSFHHMCSIYLCYEYVALILNNVTCYLINFKMNHELKSLLKRARVQLEINLVPLV